MHADDRSFITDTRKRIGTVVDDILRLGNIWLNNLRMNHDKNVNVMFSTGNSLTVQVPDVCSQYVMFLDIHFVSSLKWDIHVNYVHSIASQVHTVKTYLLTYIHTLLCFIQL